MPGPRRSRTPTSARSSATRATTRTSSSRGSRDCSCAFTTASPPSSAISPPRRRRSAGTISGSCSTTICRRSSRPRCWPRCCRILPLGPMSSPTRRSSNSTTPRTRRSCRSNSRRRRTASATRWSGPSISSTRRCRSRIRSSPETPTSRTCAASTNFRRNGRSTGGSSSISTSSTSAIRPICPIRGTGTGSSLRTRSIRRW